MNGFYFVLSFYPKLLTTKNYIVIVSSYQFIVVELVGSFLSQAYMHTLRITLVRHFFSKNTI